MIASEIRTVRTTVSSPADSNSRASKVLVIALNTFRESVRDRVLYNLILFVLILVGASVFVSDLSVSMESQFTATLALSAMLVFGALMAIFIGVGLVYKEIDKRTIYNLLSKPVYRHELVIGKYLGLCMTLLVNLLVMMLGAEIALLYVNGGFTNLMVSTLAAGYLIYLELALMVAVALMFSCFTTPMLATLFSFAAQMTGSSLARTLLTALYYLIPNLSNFGFITESSHGKIVPLRMVITATLYALIYIAVLLSASVLIFQKRNFK
jgi:ABC-type transport system involved in multi-copper enzyme maturation permease subunit